MTDNKDREVVWHWGRGGYYPITRGGGVPSGEDSWKAFAAYAPAALVERAIRVLEAMRDEGKR